MEHRQQYRKRLLPLGLAIAVLLGILAVRHHQAVTPLHVATFPGHLSDPEFSPDGRTLAVVTDQGVALWDVAGWKQIKLLPGHARYAYWTPDGKTIVTLGDHGIDLWPNHTDADVIRWDVASGKPGKIILIPNTSAYWFALSISSDLTKLFIQGTQTKPARVWDIENGKMILPLPFNHLWEPHFSPDGQFLVGVNSGQKPYLHLWDARTWRELPTLKGQTTEIKCARFSPDSKLLATGNEKQITLWNTTTWQPV